MIWKSFLVVAGIIFIRWAYNWLYVKTGWELLPQAYLVFTLGLVLLVSTFLMLVGFGGLLMAPTFPRKIFAFALLILGAWFFIFFSVLIIRSLLGEKNTPFNQLVEKYLDSVLFVLFLPLIIFIPKTNNDKSSTKSNK